MVRSKVKYELIPDEHIRQQTLRKRKAGLLKKASELKTLCNIDACAIIYSNNGGPPEVWPSPLEACHTLQRLKNLPIMTQTGNMMDQEGFLKKNVERLNKNLEKEKKVAWRLQMEQLLTSSSVENNLSHVKNIEYLKDFIHLVNEKILTINDRISVINGSVSTSVAVGNQTKNGSDRGKEKQFQ